MRCSPTETLREEHRLILQVAAVLRRLLDEPRGAALLARFDDCIAFLRLFADACHHGKEEDLLFAALESEGFSREDGPIAVMLHEHTLGRGYIREMAAAAAGIRAGNHELWPRLVGAGGQYVDLITQHIHKEDNALFDMADHALGEPACRRLCDAYETACSRRFDGHSLADLRDLADRIVH